MDNAHVHKHAYIFGNTWRVEALVDYFLFTRKTKEILVRFFFNEKR